MNYSQDGLKLTEQFESCRLTAYRDIRGKLTIGYGHTGPDVFEGQVITRYQAEQLLLADVQRAVTAINAMVRVPLTQSQFDALVDFVFNVGSGAFQTSTMLRKLNAGDTAGAAAEFARWEFCGGQKVAGLLRRREAEAEEFQVSENA